MRGNISREKLNFDFKERNRLIVEFFKLHFDLSVNLYGSDHQPIVYDNSFRVLPCYFHNYRIGLTSKKYQGEVYWIGRLDSKFIPKSKKLKWIKESKKLYLYRIKDLDTGLFLFSIDQNGNPEWKSDQWKFYYAQKTLKSDLDKLVNYNLKIV